MEHKKGFTLVELLAVISILAILTILAIPNIINFYPHFSVNKIKFINYIPKVIHIVGGKLLVVKSG